jgi:uncharacterized protein
LIGRNIMATKSGVMPVHHTQTTDDEWDSDAAERALDDDDVEAFRKEYAYVDPESPERKTGAKFPHHNVMRNGAVGPANVRALINGVGILNGGRGGADINGRERQGIYDHLAAHLKDAGREPPNLE